MLRILGKQEAPISKEPKSQVLSVAERKVLSWVAVGKTNKEIAQILDRSAASPEKTLAFYASSDLARLNPIVGDKYLQQASARGVFNSVEYVREVLNILPALPQSSHADRVRGILASFAAEEDKIIKENFQTLIYGFFANQSYVARLSADAQVLAAAFIKRVQSGSF